MEVYVEAKDLETLTLGRFKDMTSGRFKVLGKRFEIGFKIGKIAEPKMQFAIDCLVENANKIEEILTEVCGYIVKANNIHTVQMSLKGDKFVSAEPLERCAYFVDNKEDLKKILSLVKAKEKRIRKAEETLIKVIDDASLTLSSMLFKAGIKVEGFEEDTESLEIQCKFMKGYVIWSEKDIKDISDYERLYSYTIKGKIDDVVEEFNESFINNLGLKGVRLDFLVNERHQLCFYFRVS